MREDWIDTTIGDVADYLNGRGFKKSEWETKGLPIIRIQNLNNIEAPFNYTQGTFKEKYSVKNGDLLFSWAASLGVYIWNRGDAWLNQHIFKVVPKNYLLKEFLHYSLENTIQSFYAQTHGSGMVHITKKKFEATSFELPPFVEQKAIVKKIEELFSSLDSGIEDLKKAQDQLVIYRQAVLKKAFEGELTKEWRETKIKNYELGITNEKLPSADELLEQIETGRQSFYNNQIEEWEIELKKWREEGEIGKKPKKPRPLTIPDAPNNGHTERKWEIPSNWIWTQIGSLCFVTKLAGFEYTDYVNYDEDGDLPVLKAENAGTNGFKKTDFSKVKSESVKMLKRSQIFGGELLIVFVGAGTGNVAMVPFNQRYFLGPNIGMARPYFDLNSKFLELFLQSAFGKSLMMSAVKAVAQPSLSMGTIRQAPIAFPSLEEQHQIVQEIESRLSVCDTVEKDIVDSLEKAQALRQSILKKAFEGKLLSDEEIAKCKENKDYESASVLLEKIKAEKLKK